MERFDLAVIGGGPGGYHGAAEAAKSGARVALVAEGPLGGVCLNEGCVPTKALLASAKRYLAAKDGARFGVTAEGLSLSHEKAMARKNKTVKILTKGVAQTLKEGNDRPVTTVKRGDTAITYADTGAVDRKTLLAPFVRLKTPERRWEDHAGS